MLCFVAAYMCTRVPHQSHTTAHVMQVASVRMWWCAEYSKPRSLPKMLVLGLLAHALFIPIVSARLIVNPLPNILFESNGGVHNVVERSVIWLYCTANSTAATITWTKDGVALVNDPPHIRIRSSSSGMSTTSSLVVDNFQASDNGSYVCQASDGTTTVNSSTLSLTAFSPSVNGSANIAREPTVGELSYERFILPSDNRTAVRLGGTVDHVNADHGNRVLRCIGGHVKIGPLAPPSVVWVRNGEQVVADGSRIVITNSTIAGGRRMQSDLRISNFSLSDAGVYQCIFTDVDSDHEVITTIPLRLDTGGTLKLERISPQVIVLGPQEKLVLETQASGGYQNIQWTRNGNNLSYIRRADPFFVNLPDECVNFFEIFVRKPTTTRDLGVYRVNLQQSDGQILANGAVFYVTPYNPPRTTLHKTATIVTVREGDSFNISCTSAGNPIPTIAWELDGFPAPFPQRDSIGHQQLGFIQGNISSVLMISKATYPDHNGLYTCVGFNSHKGRNRTNHATITVNVLVPPEVEVTATLTRVAVGNSTTLTCTVSRSNPMGSYTYRWVHNNSITLSENSSMLTINILSESDFGVYRCEVTNSAGLSGSKMTTIGLGNPPSAVTILPADPMVMFNRSVDLVCTATGDPPINFTWVRMGEKNTHLNPDPTSGSFTLTITNPNQYGVYVCIATNDLGTDTTSVEIVQPVSVTLLASPVDVDVLSPAPAVLNCTATGEPTPQFTWTKVFPNGTTVEVSDSMSNIGISTTISGENVISTLTINATSAFDTANYSCTAENIFHNALSSQAAVTVFVVPNITFPWDSSFTYTVNERSPVKFTCSASGYPVPVLSWYRNGVPFNYDQIRVTLSEPTTELYSTDGGDMFLVSRNLTLDNTMDADTGTYTCVASVGNIVHPKIERSFQLFVRAAPNITVLDERQRVIANEGGSATMRFRIDSRTPVLLQGLRWFYSPTFAEQPNIDGEEITNQSSRTSLSTLTFSEFVDSRYINLTVSRIVNEDRRNSTATDVGRYFLTASNQFGTRFAYADLLVSERTSALLQLRLHPVRECVTWVEEKREQKFADIITAIVQSVEESCSCTFSQANVQNHEFSCRSIENSVVFRAEIIYNNPDQNGYRARDLVTFVSAWAQSGTSIVVDSTRLDVDPACPTQLESLQDGDCEALGVEATLTPTVNTEATITPNVNTIIISAAIGGGCLILLLVIFIIVMAIILVRCKRRKESDKSTDYDHECPKFPIDVAAPLKTNPSYGINATRDQVVPVNNIMAGTYMSPRLLGPPEKKGEDEEEDHTYEPIPFDYCGH